MSKSCGCSEKECQEMTFLMSQYADGELSKEECAKLRAKMEHCERCRELFEMNKALKLAVKKHCSCQGVPDKIKSSVQNLLQSFNRD